MSRAKAPNTSKYFYVEKVFKASWHEGLHVVSYAEKHSPQMSLVARAWHWIAKVFIPKTIEDVPPHIPVEHKEQAVEQENKHRYDHFLADQLLDSYLSRLCHAIIPFAPKGKFVDNARYVSRLYPFDQTNSNKDTAKVNAAQVGVKGYDLHCVALKLEAGLPLQGIVKALVFNMIVENWDNKLSNYTAYPAGSAGEGYKVAPFDFPFSLQRHQTHAKIWNEEQLAAVIDGTSPASLQKNVAAALAETIGELGERTSAHYSKHVPEYQAVFQKIKTQVTDAIGAELDAINPADHSRAVISVFKELLGDMQKHKDDVYQKVHQDINDKLTLDSRYIWVKESLLEYHARLGENLEKFGEFLRARDEKQARFAYQHAASAANSTPFAARIRQASASAAEASPSRISRRFTIRIEGDRHPALAASSFNRH